jgi:hypothetical protein
VCTDDRVVGHLWLHLRRLSTEVEAYVYDVEVLPAERGRGLGLATMHAGAEAAAGLGASMLRLTVFGDNAAALALYHRAGLSAVRSLHTRPLDVPVPAARVRLAPMEAADYTAFRDHLADAHPAALATVRVAPLQEARGAVADLAARLLPRGRAGAEGRLLTAHDGTRPVARVLLEPGGPGPSPATVHVLQLLGGATGPVLPDVLRAVARHCAERGAPAVAVPVVGTDPVLEGTLTVEGFRLTARLMVQPLGAWQASGAGGRG